MSDPLANDVEDVLTSIRRLVRDTSADGDEGQTEPVSEAQPEAPKPEMREALILTSALRVDGQEARVDEAEDAPDEAVELTDATAEDQADPAQDDTHDALDGREDRPVDPHFSKSSADLGSLRQAVSGAFMGEPVMPAVLHSTKNVKKAADVSSALEASKGWAGRPSEDYYEDEDTSVSELAQWRDASKSPATEDAANDDVALASNEAEGRQEADAFATDDMSQGDVDLTADAPVFREDASDYGEDWTEEVEPEAPDASLTVQELAEDHPAVEGEMTDLAEDDDALESAEPEADVSEANVPDADATDESDLSLASMSGKTDDISDEYEWDEEPEGDAAIATFRHVPVDVSQLREAGSFVGEGAQAAAADTGIPASAAFDAESDMAGAALESDAAAPKSQGDSVDLGDLDEAVLDEDMLRELVSDIVRKELSGDLGERITRNVRKLVRREIHRALETRELD